MGNEGEREGMGREMEGNWGRGKRMEKWGEEEGKGKERGRKWGRK